jgi:hypothetical protein
MQALTIRKGLTEELEFDYFKLPTKTQSYEIN